MKAKEEACIDNTTRLKVEAEDKSRLKTYTETNFSEEETMKS